jgi:hypothetical protein
MLPSCHFYGMEDEYWLHTLVTSSPLLITCFPLKIKEKKEKGKRKKKENQVCSYRSSSVDPL